MKCEHCNGTGQVRLKTNVGWVMKLCPVCQGKGEERISADDVLVLVDMQNGYRNDYTEPAIQELLMLFKKVPFYKVVATKFINYEESWFHKELHYTYLMKPDEQDIIPEFKPFVTTIFLKDSYNCVTDGFVDQLRILNHGTIPQNVLLAGFDTEGCVLATAMGLFEKGIRPCILVDCIGSSQGIDNHLCGLKTMEKVFGLQSLIRLG